MGFAQIAFGSFFYLPNIKCNPRNLVAELLPTIKVAMLTDYQKLINVKFFLVFIPVAYFTFMFHEFGHWIVGEIFENRMVYNLHRVWPKDGHYLQQSHELYVSIGGPAFTVLQAVIALLIIEKFRTPIAYPFAFFAMFFRFFTLLLSGFSKQDEARIAVLLGTWTYLIAIIVLAILLLIVIRCSHKLGIMMKINGYLVAVSAVCHLLVVGTHKFLRL